MKYKISQFAKKENVTYRTVWNWVKNDKVKYETKEDGHILIIEDEIDNLNVAIYARVSSSENKDNLERQKERLISYCNAKGYKISKIVTEIGSGLNDTRPKLESLLVDSSINLIVVEHSDRLARFGLNYIQKLLALSDRRIEILNPQENEENDLVQDLKVIKKYYKERNITI